MIRIYQPKPVGRPARVFHVGMVSGTLPVLAAHFGLKPDTVLCRLRRGWPVHKAFTSPPLAPAFPPGCRRRGTRHRSAKLNEVNVLQIRQRAATGEALRKLAREFQVTQAAIQCCVRGVTWSHVGGPLSPLDADRLRQSHGGTPPK